jgi:transposase
VHEYGNGALLMKISQDFLNDLRECFPHRWKELLACAIVKTIQPVALRLVKSRWEKLHVSCELEASLSPKTHGEVLRDTGKEYAFQKKFFDTLTKKSRTLAFDMSSFFSHSENLRFAEKGYNKDHAYTKQVNFVLFFSLGQQIPVLLKTLHGSVRDVKALISVIDEVDAKKSIFVLDRGFASYTVPDLLKQHSFSFILPLRRNFKIIDYEKECKHVFTYRKRGIKWAKWKAGKHFLYLFEDVKMRAEEETACIEMMEEGKKTRKRYLNDSKQFGKISMLSDLDIDGEKVYRMLKSREEVEKAFDALKN